MATTRQQPEPTAVCAFVTSQTELDAALANGACIHVRNDAEQSVKDWDGARQAAAAAAYQAAAGRPAAQP